MSKRYIAYAPPAFYDAMKAEGYELPPGCGDMELLIPVDGMVRLRLDVIITAELLGQIGRALARCAANTEDA